MSFTLLPAVDVTGGRVARADGSLDPVESALAWQADGAGWIHLVDLDAAFGRGSNAEVIAAVIGALDVPVELAGGIHGQTSLEAALATGCERVVIGAAALADLTWSARAIAEHGERIAVSLDVSVDVDGVDGNRLIARGGMADTGDVWDVLAELDRAGCARYIVTDVSRDGRLNGPNLELLRAVTAATSARVIASGGIASLADLAALAERGDLEGAVVGSALLAGRFTLPEALAAVGRA